MKKLVLTVFFVVICFNLLAQSRTIKVGLDNNYPPYEYVDKHGEIKGFNFTFLRKLNLIPHIHLNFMLILGQIL
jgi:ABC-type amino acid transport substrate-binding protein